MVSVKGIIKNGVVEPLEPIEAKEGQEVDITWQEDKTLTTENISPSSWDDFLNFIDENAIDTGIVDLAHQHDHYLYGTPKKSLTLNESFVDTAAWIALLNKKDNLHLPARQIMEILRQQKAYLLTTDFVVLEVADAFSLSLRKAVTIEYINRLRVLEDLIIIPVSEQLFTLGWQLYSQRLDKDWGLTDCTSFVVMN